MLGYTCTLVGLATHSERIIMKQLLRSSSTLVVLVCAFAIPATHATAATGLIGYPTGSTAWITEFPPSQYASQSVSLTGDVDGDGRTDAIVDFAGTWYVALSTGSKFAPYSMWLGAFAPPVPGITQLVADVNGDGKDDAVAVENGVWKVALANSAGTGFNPPAAIPFVTGFGAPATGSTFTYMLGDIDGDKKADAVCFEKNVAQGKATWSAALSNGSSFVKSANPWATNLGTYALGTVAKLADVTGDGRSDAVFLENGKWNAATSNGVAFGSPNNPSNQLSSTLGMNLPMLADVNGDGKSDGLSVSIGGTWTVALASTTPGVYGDIPSFGAPTTWGKGVIPPANGATSGAPMPIQYFVVDLDGTVPSGATKGTAESLAVKGGTWWGWAATTPAQYKASGPPALDENFDSLDWNRWSTPHYDYWYNGQPTRGSGVVTPNSNLETGTYTAANNTVSNGILSQAIGVTGTGTNAAYTIGSLNSLGRFDANGQYIPGTGFRFKEGYVEASIYVPKNIDCGGCWPAFWMLSAPSINAKTGLTETWEHQCRSKPEEVDIFEFFPNLGNDLQYFDTHWGTCVPSGLNNWGDTTVSNNLDTAPAQTRQVVGTKLAGGYHTYGMLRTATKLQFFVDGIASQEVTVGLPQKEMYLILTLQRGKDNTPPVNMTFPATTNGVNMKTEYIKVWR